jgi:hypothetical protein
MCEDRWDWREGPLELATVLEQSVHLFETGSGTSEAKEDLSESLGTTKVSSDGRRSSLTAMAR